MRRFPGYIDYEEVQTVIWKSEDNPDSWKDFVELAKAAGAPFLTMDSWALRREELDEMLERLGKAEFTNDEDLEEALAGPLGQEEAGAPGTHRAGSVVRRDEGRGAP